MKKITFLLLIGLLCITAYSAPASGTSSANVDLNIQAEENITTRTELVRMKKAQAAEVAVVIRQALSKYGNVQINEKKNMIIITDIPDMIKNLVQVAKELDTKGFASADGLETEVLYLKYVHPQDVESFINHKVSPQGVLKVNSDLNSIIITDVPSRIEEIKVIIEKIDKPVKHVCVEVKILEMNFGDDKDIGINWNAILESIGSGISTQSTPLS